MKDNLQKLSLLLSYGTQMKTLIYHLTVKMIKQLIGATEMVPIPVEQFIVLNKAKVNGIRKEETDHMDKLKSSVWPHQQFIKLIQER